MSYILKLNKLKNLNNLQKLSIHDLVSYISINKTLDDLEKLHIYLINKVNRIHKNEISQINTNLCKTTLNIKDCIIKCEDIRIGGKIYFLNNQGAINYVFGDIHSDSHCIVEFLKKISFVERVQRKDNIRLVFLGDYVDRGKASFKTLELILILKYIFPSNIFLLKGNHDGGALVSDDEYKLCVGRNENTTDNDYFVASTFNRLKELNKPLVLLKKYLKFFNELCHIAIIQNGNETVLCVHGGIPRHRNEEYHHIKTISDLWNKKKVDLLKGNIVHNMLWSDPAEDTSMQRNTRRFYFYKSHFLSFTSRLSIDTIIRGHQAFDEGYKEFFDGRLISIFSSGTYKMTNNETAYKNISPCILKLSDNNKEIIRLQEEKSPSI